MVSALVHAAVVNFRSHFIAGMYKTVAVPPVAQDVECNHKICGSINSSCSQHVPLARILNLKLLLMLCECA